jgi:hypothetical protein
MVFDFLGAIRLVFIGIDRFLQSSGGEIKENAKGLFENVIEPSFRQLATVHDDYMRNLSALKEHLEKKDLPPRDILQWLHDAGLNYRADREYLRTIEAEIEGAKRKKLAGKKRAAELQRAFEGYCKSIIGYWYKTNPSIESTLYRDFETSLRMALVSSASSSMSFEWARDSFYESEEVRKVLQTLSEVAVPDYHRSGWKYADSIVGCEQTWIIPQ